MNYRDYLMESDSYLDWIEQLEDDPRYATVITPMIHEGLRQRRLARQAMAEREQEARLASPLTDDEVTAILDRPMRQPGKWLTPDEAYRLTRSGR